MNGTWQSQPSFTRVAATYAIPPPSLVGFMYPPPPPNYTTMVANFLVPGLEYLSFSFLYLSFPPPPPAPPHLSRSLNSSYVVIASSGSQCATVTHFRTPLYGPSRKFSYLLLIHSLLLFLFFLLLLLLLLIILIRSSCSSFPSSLQSSLTVV